MQLRLAQALGKQCSCHLVSPLAVCPPVPAGLPLAPSWFRWGRMDEVRGRKGGVCPMLSGADGVSLWAWQLLKPTLPVLGQFGFFRDSRRFLGHSS